MKTCHEIHRVSPPAPAPALADRAQALEKAERLKSPTAIRGRALKLKCAGNTERNRAAVRLLVIQSSLGSQKHKKSLKSLRRSTLPKKS